ncbi:MAG: class I SAM-dependent methyltransferase [Ahrensia sp.]
MAFSADWLALREPVDHASRDGALLAQATALAGQNAAVADLGSGTGSTARAFTDDMCQGWSWRFFDSDKALLTIASKRHPSSQSHQFDLADISTLDFGNINLVTASALLDLMPQSWVEALAQKLSHAGVPFYASLNYNGVMHWSPPGDEDASITGAFNEHQRTDKGLGPALGPASASETMRIFQSHGFTVIAGDSPWRLDAQTIALHEATLEGIASAASDAGCEGASDWLDHRKTHLASTTGYIGHTDLLAIPHDRRP